MYLEPKWFYELVIIPTNSGVFVNERGTSSTFTGNHLTCGRPTGGRPHARPTRLAADPAGGRPHGRRMGGAGRMRFYGCYVNGLVERLDVPQGTIIGGPLVKWYPANRREKADVKT